MQFIELTLPSLGELDDGRVAAAFLHELKRAVQDCIDRPSDKNARKVCGGKQRISWCRQSRWYQRGSGAQTY